MSALKLDSYWGRSREGVLKVIESYEVNGQRRFRVRLEGTKIVINVEAETPEEAISKARELAVKLKIIKE